MRRIYFLAPNIKTTHAIVEELRNEGIEDRHIHILAKRDTPLEDMPEASVLQKTDFISALERGVVLGGTTGLLAGLAYSGFVIAGGPVLGIIMAGATIGSLMGGLLVLHDIPMARIGEITQKIIKHHPKAAFEGIELILPLSY
jgi:hypothetical protein